MAEGMKAGRKTMTRWAWNDAWILTATSLVHEKGGATLAEIIGAADVINHAIPTARELSRAFSRLVNAGIVQARQGRYRLAPNRMRAVRKALAATRGLYDKIGECRKWLKDSGLKPHPSTTVTVSDSEVRAAYDDYCALLRKR
jgi:hypothetical protein